jgi:sortase A
MEKQRGEWDTRRPKYAVYRRRRRITLFILVLLILLVGLGLHGLGTYLSSNTTQETSNEPSEQVSAPTAEQTAPEETVTEEQTPQETVAQDETTQQEEDTNIAPVPDEPTLFLTVPKLGLYHNTVRNDRSESALDLGAIKLPDTGFPWQKGANTYMACHRLGWPGLESYNQCLNLPLMQQGDEIYLSDTNGTVYEYRVSEILVVSPEENWVANPVEGKDMVSLQTCVENAGDWWTLGPNWFARFVVRAERV